MESWLPLAVFALFMGALMVGLSRWQARRYQHYLDRHTEETAKLVTQQRETLQIMERQTAALDRIAAALEQRP